MKLGWAAFCIVLALHAFSPRPVAAQGVTPVAPKREQPSGTLGQNFPNPFNPETRIPFVVGDAPTCSDPDKQHRVTLRIYNLLAQLVAVPVLQGGSGGVAGGAEIENLGLTCAQYTAYWDGKDRRTGGEVASGIYLYRLEVDGRAVVRKMIVTK